MSAVAERDSGAGMSALRGLSAAVAVAVGLLSIGAFVSEPIAGWTIVALCAFLLVLGAAMTLLLRGREIVFALIAALFADLVIGRLFSTMRLVEDGAPPVSIDPLLVAETGPGLPFLTYATTILFVLLTAQLLIIARRDSRAVGRATAEQWALTAIRIYAGLMFIAHFAGHLFAGPAPFAVFADYFGSIGLPWPAAFVILAGLIEIAVTIGLAFGLMTRLAAFGATAYLFVSVGLGGHYSVGYVWVLPTGGWEFPALWMFVTAVFMFAGGGPLSLDTRIRGAWPGVLPRLFA